MKQLKNEAYISLYEKLCNFYREDQFHIKNSDTGFTVNVKHLPPNIQIPSKISYWNVNVKKVKNL